MSKTLVIAEIGVNHNGNFKKAKELVAQASKCGADIVKFQIFKTEEIVTKKVKKTKYQLEKKDKNIFQYKMLKKLELNEQSFFKLKKLCKKYRVEFCASCFDLDSLYLLKKLNPKRIKIPSGEITNYFLLKKIGSMGKKIILSTGMSNTKEISQAIKLLIKSGSKLSNIHLLHCNTEYPTPLKDVNLNAIKSLKKKFKVQVGYSDHTKSIEVPIAAVTMGARVIEKHFTLKNTAKGPDHKASLNPKEFKFMVNSIRNTEKLLGSKNKNVTQSEKKNIDFVRKSVVASKRIKKDQKFTHFNLTAKRAGKGISPMDINKILKKRAKTNFEKDETIKI